MVMGDVTYKRGKAKAKPIRKTTKLKQKDLIRTLVESSVELKMEDGTTITIEENSVVNLSKFVKNGKVTNTKINIKTGKILFNVKKLASRRSDFIMETPTATAAIRGTEGGIGTDGKSTFAYLKEGLLDLVPKGGGKKVRIKELNVAIQKAGGFSVKVLENQEALKNAIEKVVKSAVNLDSLKKVLVGDSVLVKQVDTAGVIDTMATPDSTGRPLDTLTQKRDSLSSVSKGDMILNITSPASPAEVSGDEIEIVGFTLPGAMVKAKSISQVADASGHFAMKLRLPIKPGKYKLDVQSFLGKQEAKAVLKFIVKKPENISLIMSNPVDGQEFPQGSDVTFTGTVTAGSQVKINQGLATVSGENWSYTLSGLSIGKHKVMIEANFGLQVLTDEVSIVLTQKKVDLKFTVASPAFGTEIKTPQFTVSGTASPGATIKVGAVLTAATTAGQWKVSLVTPKEFGEHRFSVEASLVEQSLTAEVAIVVPVPELTFSVEYPEDGQEINANKILSTGLATPGARIKVLGAQTEANASGRWSLSISSPAEEGTHSLPFQAELEGQNLTEELSIERVFKKAEIKGKVNPVPSEINTPKLTVSGTCNDEARIEIGSFNTTTKKGGAWKLEISWPEQEEGTQEYDVFCILNGEEVGIGQVNTEYTRPRIPLVLELSTPLQVFQKAGELGIKGTVKGREVILKINDKPVTLSQNKFSKSFLFDESNWDLEEIEVVISDGEEEISKIIVLEVDKTSPAINRRKPAFIQTPFVEADKAIRFGVKDSPGDEVEVRIYVDGDEEESFTFEDTRSGYLFNLVAGEHDYKIEAEDKARNILLWKRLKIAYWPRVEWSIVMMSPIKDRSILLPPSTPDNEEYDPRVDVRFRIESLPNDDYRYLKEVKVMNEASGEFKVWRGIEIDDVDFEFDDLKLFRKRMNRIVIRVEPKLGPIRTKIITYDLK